MRAKTSQGWGEFTPAVYRVTSAVRDGIYSIKDAPSSTTPAIVGAVVAVIVLLLLVAVVVTLYLRRNGDDWAKKQVLNLGFYIFLRFIFKK